MQLTKIKLSGFKSFVDPTTISLPSNLIAIVGPNGCGKSNVIDAVSWVMGESSPKQLRGESLTDVIFNGSNVRKPVGQASVELVFDNADSTIGGEYAKYAEISIKRVLARDSNAAYYLNGVQCRKRDITDIFLGTGLGPRRYSIIGQNMINQVIESKPEELRIQLEEAAGISKYKERRHETALSISHTRDNMTRLADICSELEKQLSSLRHQANMAEKYQTFKQDERLLRAELCAIEWRELDQALQLDGLHIQQKETALEKENSELSATDVNLEQLRQDQHEAQAIFDAIQKNYYAVGNEITRLEQDILHHETRQNQLNGDLARIAQDLTTINQQRETTNGSLQTIDSERTMLAPQLVALIDEFERIKEQYQAAEKAMQDAQKRWDDYHESSQRQAQIVQVEKNNIQQIEQKINFLKQQLEQSRAHQDHPLFSKLTDEIATLLDLLEATKQNTESERQSISKNRSELAHLQDTLKETIQQSNNNEEGLRALRNQIALLQALQQVALGKEDKTQVSWVTKHALNTKPRLAEQLQVESGWELALSMVLGYQLQAICVNQLDEVIHAVADYPSGNLCIIAGHDIAEEKTSSAINNQSLLDKIKSSWPLASLLSGIYVASSLDEALKQRNQLAQHESIITQDGIWLSKSWMKISRTDDPKAGFFQREKEIKKVNLEIEKSLHQKKAFEQASLALRDQIKQYEQRLSETQTAFAKLEARTAEINIQLNMKKERSKELHTQIARVEQDQTTFKQQIATAEAELIQKQEAYQKALLILETSENERHSIAVLRETSQKQFYELRDHVNRKTAEQHALEIRMQAVTLQHVALEEKLRHFDAQQTALNQKSDMLQLALKELPVLAILKRSLSEVLNQHVQIESALNTARNKIESLNEARLTVSEARQVIEKEINRLRSSLESLRVETQSRKVKAEALVEKLNETTYALPDILKTLPEEGKSSEWQDKLNRVINRIERLGAINLVAIEEYKTCQERKTYLDQQMADLEAGLKTLEDAISKIDKETRVRFKETFDQVNARFQALFPTIFGGGHATLILNDENLLEAGVSVMACPPGKRNSSIHLLSGGEKSLTALAFVFSIFYLNPAPFCLLDEVDAALDDMNVLRFAKLVKSMADKTQFIFISHNKVTMEIGTCLIGVTMHEPGVSRLVSVDIEEAMRFADA